MKTRPGKHSPKDSLRRNRGKLVPVKTGMGKTVKMLKKVTTDDIKAAVALIVAENIAALRMFVRNITNSIFKSTAKNQDAKWWGKKRPKLRKG